MRAAGVGRSAVRAVPAVAVVAGLVLAAAGCGAPADRPASPEGLGLRAMELPYPLGKVDFTLNDTEGRPFPFRARTDGALTLLYFGYTYCPDVCPVQMGTPRCAGRSMWCS